MKVAIYLPILLGAGLLASCAQKSTSSSGGEQHRTLSQRMNEKSGFSQDSEGNWKPKVDRRSSFESVGESPYFKGDYAKKEYKAGEYAKKSWWGSKEYERKTYDGAVDGSRFTKTSRFDGSEARDGKLSAREGGTTYETENYATSEAREASGKRMDRPSDAETDSRRRVFQQPQIIDYRDQRKLTLQETKSFLGRD
ncbi:MAG: hypothetical protein CFE26_02365 [Verrucomicrobiales bacterium VVV1]|nr:MAG: hypothetical protein CFE26_02365 [Verrucomicrobiales bacterium VVV1]